MARKRDTLPAVATEAQKWLRKIDRAKKVKEDWLKTFRVSLAYDYLEGRQRPTHVADAEWVTINLYYANLRALLPTLYRVDPYFYVRLRRSYKPNPMLIALYEQKARLRQSMLNYLKAELRLKQKIRLAILDSFFQFGCIKSVSSAELIENPNAGAPMTDEENLVYDDAGNPLTEPDLLPANHEYKITRVHPKDILWDEDAGPLEDDWRWIGQRIRRPIEDVRTDRRYPASVRKNVQATEVLSDFDREEQIRKKGLLLQDIPKDASEIVVEWHLYDLAAEEWMVVAEGNDDFLLEPEELPEGIEGHPFSFLRFFPRDNSVYPIPPATQWLDPQREYCEGRAKMAVHRKRFNRKYEVMVSGLADETEMTKLEIGEDGTLIRKTVPQPVVSPISDAPLDQGLYLELGLLRKDFDDLATGPNQRGSATGVDSATEAGIIEKRVQIQEGDDISLVCEFASDIARKLDQLIQVSITEDQAIKVEGEDGRFSWQLVRASDYEAIEGEYEYEVNVSSMVPQLPEIERAQLIQLVTAFASAPIYGTEPAFVRYVAERFGLDSDLIIEAIVRASKAQVALMGAAKQPGSAPGSPGLPGSALPGAALGMANIRGGTQGGNI